MVASSSDGSWLDPKWFVIGFSLAVFALLVSYDLRLGLAFGVLLGLAAAGWLYLAIRFAAPAGAQPSGRRAMVERFARHFSNRRLAERRRAEPVPPAAPGGVDAG